MKKLSLAAILVIASPVIANAQLLSVDSNSASQSGANAMVFQEGSEWGNNTPAVSAPSMNNTTTCAFGQSAGFSVPGFGISFGGGRTDPECNTREETRFLHDLVRQPNNKARAVAIAHACAHDASLRSTLVSMGLCQVAGQTSSSVRQSSVSRAPRGAGVETQNRSARATATAYTSCRLVDGQLRVSPRSGFSAQQASDACLQAWRNGQI